MAYQEVPHAPAQAKRQPAVLARCKKLESELGDARISLHFVQTAVSYAAETRPAAIERGQLIITNLENNGRRQSPHWLRPAFWRRLAGL